MTTFFKKRGCLKKKKNTQFNFMQPLIFHLLHLGKYATTKMKENEINSASLSNIDSELL